jgi:hypothetical protein
VLFNKKAIADQQAQLSRDAKTAIRKAKRAAVRASQHLSTNDRYSSEEEEEEEEHDNKGAALLGVKKKDKEWLAAEGLVLLSGSDEGSVGVGRSAGHTGSRPPFKKKSVKFAAAPVWR